MIDAESPSSTHTPEALAAAPRTRTSGKSSKNSLRRRSRELALQGLYDWLLSREQVSEIELHMRAQDDFLPCDEAHFEALLRGCIEGLVTFALFFQVLKMTLGTWPAPLAYGFALLATLIVAAGVLTLQRRRTHH